MATAAEVLSMLVDADQRLSKEYSRATPHMKTLIEIFSQVKYSIVNEIIIADIHSRTGQIKALTKEIKSAEADLKALKQTIDKIKKLGEISQKTLNALTALLPLL